MISKMEQQRTHTRITVPYQQHSLKESDKHSNLQDDCDTISHQGPRSLDAPLMNPESSADRSVKWIVSYSSVTSSDVRKPINQLMAVFVALLIRA